MTRIAAMLCFLCVCGPTLSQAEALIQTLPEDGSWINFRVTLKVQDVETQPIWSLRSVGKKVVDGEPCRWIEMQSRENDKTVLIFKILVPEKEFGAGKNPLSKPKTVWFKVGDEEPPRELASIADGDPALAVILDGLAGDFKKREKKEPIAWQNGNFESDVFEGKNSQELFGNKFEVEHTVWKHTDVPFGITAMKQTIKVQIGDQSGGGAIDMSVKEFGKDAKSVLPQVQ